MDTAKNPHAMDDPRWVCSVPGCGARPVEAFSVLSPDKAGRWRWAGDHWQHHHGYPGGHIAAVIEDKETP